MEVRFALTNLLWCWLLLMALFTNYATCIFSFTSEQQQLKFGNAEDSDFDISVFQFTLGIPGIPDEQVPRILGLVTGSLLLLNHILSVSSKYEHCSQPSSFVFFGNGFSQKRTLLPYAPHVRRIQWRQPRVEVKRLDSFLQERA